MEIIARSKSIILIAAVAENGVIGDRGGIPWHVPEDFAHFKKATTNQVVVMGRTTFDSIGRPLPNRRTIVVTRNKDWSHAGVLSASSLQSAIDLAEDLDGEIMVAGGSHIYAAAFPVASMQILTTIHQSPAGDTFYPVWDQSEWRPEPSEPRADFTVQRWHRLPRPKQTCYFELPMSSVDQWWSADWSERLTLAVQRAHARGSKADGVNWAAVHQAAAQVIIEAAEDHLRSGGVSGAQDVREVRLNRHMSMSDFQAVQRALFHWSDFISPRRSTTSI